MNGKLIPVFVLAALMSCSQPPVKEQGPRPVKLAEVTSLNLVEKSFSGVVSPDQFSDLAFKMSGPLFSNCRSTVATCEEAVIQTGYFEAGI